MKREPLLLGTCNHQINDVFLHQSTHLQMQLLQEMGVGNPFSKLHIPHVSIHNESNKHVNAMYIRWFSTRLD